MRLHDVAHDPTYADLAIAKPATGIAEAFTNTRLIDEVAFNPWNTTEEFRPLGNLSRDLGLFQDTDGTGYLLS